MRNLTCDLAKEITGATHLKVFFLLILMEMRSWKWAPSEIQVAAVSCEHVCLDSLFNRRYILVCTLSILQRTFRRRPPTCPLLGTVTVSLCPSEVVGRISLAACHAPLLPAGCSFNNTVKNNQSHQFGYIRYIMSMLFQSRGGNLSLWEPLEMPCTRETSISPVGAAADSEGLPRPFRAMREALQPHGQRR